jgi:two-component system phosphate regulon response regulator OmpR
MEAGRMEPGERQSVVVVDDEPEIRAMLADYLALHGFTVEPCADGAALDEALKRTTPDVIVLDVRMPGEDGLSIARRLRAESDVPILMLTAADDIVDRIVGLEMGADDYLTKPFDLRELRARRRALIRRSRAGPPAAPPAPAAAAHCVPFGRVVLDLDAHCLVSPDGTAAKLTAMEFDLLAVFARHPNRVLSRSVLLDLAHDRAEEPFDRSIDIRIARLRKKIENDPTRPEVLRTVRGAGYMFVPPKS